MLLAGDGQSLKARKRRRAYPIHGYLGRNGAGKSLCAVYDTLPDLDAGLPCLSTVRLLDYRRPRPCDGTGPWPNGLCDRPGDHDPDNGREHAQAHPGYVPFARWEQLLAWRRGPVIMDEITGVADSADNDLPGPVRDFLAQMRRADVSVRITGINWIRVNKRLREVVNAVTRCRSSMPVSVTDPDGHERAWRARRLAKWVTYDAQTLPVDDHTEHAYDEAEVLVKARHWIPTSPARTAYDTFDAVSRVGSVTDSGRCVTCAGLRRAPECGCPDYVADRAARRGSPRRELATERGASRGSGRHVAGPPVLVSADSL